VTWNNPTMSYGVGTVQALAEMINRALNLGAPSVIPPTKPYPSWGPPDGQIPPPSERR
jgi:hypothetical protein